MRKDGIDKFIMATLSDIAAREQLPLSAPLVPASIIFGQNGILDSMLLVELMLALEDFCAEHNLEFNWSNDSAMSEKRSVYRTVESLSDYIARQNPSLLNNE